MSAHGHPDMSGRPAGLLHVLETSMVEGVGANPLIATMPSGCQVDSNDDSGSRPHDTRCLYRLPLQSWSLAIYVDSNAELAIPQVWAMDLSLCSVLMGSMAMPRSSILYAWRYIPDIFPTVKFLL